MLSVIIAAHNEAAVIGRCLDALMQQDSNVPANITVVANGCTDRTAEIAREHGVRVVEVEEPSKAVALNVGDQVAQGFPRIYLDADIIVPGHALRRFAGLFAAPEPPLAAVPGRRVDLSRRPLLVKAYFAINTRLPAFQDGLFGRGMIALSESARSRFDAFPIMVADDLFLDSQYSADEKATVASVEVVVAAPLRTADLVRRLVRVRRGNAAMRQASQDGVVTVRVRHADRLAWLRAVVIPQPHLAPAAVAYISITALAAMLAKRRPRMANAWERDESTRVSESAQDQVSS